jgi:hypothetical protein
MAGLRAAQEGRRPRALSREGLWEVQALMKSSDMFSAQVYKRIDMSKATLYRYVGPTGTKRK